MALRQDGHPAADLLHYLHLVGDDDHRDAEGTVQLLEQGQDGLGGGGVQGGGGLVTEEHLGVRGESPCDGHPLLLAAGELGGIGALPVLQAHDLQEFPGPGDGFLPGRAGELQREADVVQGAALHQQVEALKDHGDGLPGLAQLLGGEGGDLLTVHPDGALRGGLQQVHAAHQGAFSGAGEADDAVDLSLFNAQVDAVQRGDGGLALAEGLPQTPDLNDGLAHRISPLNLRGAQKNAPDACSQASRAELAPRYHLASSGPRGTDLSECRHTLARSRALPSQPMHISVRSVRNSKTMFPAALRTRFHPPGSLCRTSAGTLLFLVFAVLFSC